MSVDQFLKLKELDSLTKMRHQILFQKEEQENRVSKLQERSRQEILQATNIKQNLAISQTELSSLEHQIQQASKQKQHLIENGESEERIAGFTEKIDRLEDEGLLLLERLDALTKELADNKTFLIGLEKTLAEIQQESQSEIKRLDREQENIKLRIQLLLEDLSPEFRTTFERVFAKKLAHGPFTRVEQGRCFFCRYQISRLDESQIDSQKELKSCSQCGRIFLPYGA